MLNVTNLFHVILLDSLTFGEMMRLFPFCTSELRLRLSEMFSNNDASFCEDEVENSENGT